MNTRSISRAAAAAATVGSGQTDSRVTTRGTGTSQRVHSQTRSASTSTLTNRANSVLTRYRFNRTRQLMKLERKLIRSCEHVILLNDKIRGLTKRYQKARAEGFKSFRYNLRIRLAAVEGVRNMYYEYARDRAEEVAELRKELYDQNVTIIAGNDDESEDDVSDNHDDYDASSEGSDDDDSMMETDDETS